MPECASHLALRAIHAGDVRRGPGAKRLPGLAWLSVADGVHVSAHECRQIHAGRALLQTAPALLAVHARESERRSQSEIYLLLRSERQVLHDREVLEHLIEGGERGDGRMNVLVLQHPLERGFHVDLPEAQLVPVDAGLRLHRHHSEAGLRRLADCSPDLLPVGLPEIVGGKNYVPEAALSGRPDHLGFVAVRPDPGETRFPLLLELLECADVGLEQNCLAAGDRYQVVDVDMIKAQTLQAALHGFRNRLRIDIGSDAHGSRSTRHGPVRKVGTGGDHEGITGSVPEHLSKASLMIPLGIPAGSVDIDDSMIQRGVDKIDSIGGSHAHDR